MSKVQSVDRVLNLLELVSEKKDGTTISDLTSKTDLHKSTIHRLLGALVENGYIVQTEDQKYKISYKLYKLGVNALSGTNVVETARDIIKVLSKDVKEVVHLVVRDDVEVVYVDKENSYSNLSIMGSRIGSNAPMYTTSVGKALLFNAEESEIKYVWDNSEIKKITTNTHTDYKSFLKDVMVSKERGYAIDDEENEKGIKCTGAPICNFKNEIVAAISISVPIAHIEDNGIEYYAQKVKDSALEISRRLGYLGN